MDITKKKLKTQKIILGIIGLAVFFGVWQAAVKLGWVSERSLKAPTDIIQTFITKLTEKAPDGATLPTHFLSSLKLALSSFAIATIIGVPLGWLMGYYKKLNMFLNPLFEIIRPIPPIAWIPIVILTLGIGFRAKMFIIFVAAFVPNVINSYLGIRMTDMTMINVAKTYGATDWEIFTKVCIPSSSNLVFTGVRLSLNASWTTLVAAEMLASTQGLGYMIQMGRTIIRPDIIIVGMFTIGMTGALLNIVLSLFEKKVAPWRYRN